MTDQKSLEQAAEEYAKRRFKELRGIAPDEFTWKDSQYGRELMMMFQAHLAGAEWMAKRHSYNSSLSNVFPPRVARIDGVLIEKDSIELLPGDIEYLSIDEHKHFVKELEAELEAYRVEHCKQRFGRNK